MRETFKRHPQNVREKVYIDQLKFPSSIFRKTKMFERRTQSFRHKEASSPAFNPELNPMGTMEHRYPSVYGFKHQRREFKEKKLEEILRSTFLTPDKSPSIRA